MQKISALTIACLLVGACAAGAAERVVFPGGQDILVREVRAQGEFLELHLLEGGTILLPKSAVASRSHVDPREALEEWKSERRGATVAGRRGGDAPRSERDLDWEERMKLLSEAEERPFDAGFERDMGVLRGRGGARGDRPGSGGTLQPYGHRAPTEADVHPPGMKRDVRRIPLATWTPGSRQASDYKPGAGPARQGAGRMDPRIRAFYENGGEPPPPSRPAELRRNDGD